MSQAKIKAKKQQALYPYTLQPIALNMTDAEFKSAQLALFEKTAQSVGFKSMGTKEWIILGVLVVLAILGLVFVSGYSTIIFWVMLFGVGIYLALRTLGLQWYMKKEFEKQVANSALPDEMNGLKLGVQNHGLIMSIPTKNAPTAQMRGMNLRHAPIQQQGVIPWSAVNQWDETDGFIFIMFELNGQRGSQILPKRLSEQHFPINTVIKHLQEVTPKGLKTDNITI